MSRLALASVLTLTAGAAVAHPSLVPHAHPHGWSMLLGFDAVALAALAILAATGAVLWAVRRSKK